MSIFDEIIDNLKELFEFKDDDWIKWIAEENPFYDDCDKFDRCYFMVKHMPRYPQHKKCKCIRKKIEKPIPYKSAFSDCSFSKFHDYLFSPKYNDGKQEIFEKWGFFIENSEYLRDLYEKQGLEKYCKGQYVFKGTNVKYPKIEIIIDLEDRYGKIHHIKTGWEIQPMGIIRLITPYSGHTSEGKIMDKYMDNSLVEEMDSIVLLNENYANLGLHKGYIGTVVANLIKLQDLILVDFEHPFTGDYIYVQAEVNKKDFRVLKNNRQDNLCVKEYAKLVERYLGTNGCNYKGNRRKYADNSLVEEMDSIVLLNENYANLGLHKGYIGTVINNNAIENAIIVEFKNPITNEKICEKVKINFKDFTLLNSSYADFDIRKKYAEKFFD